MFISFFCQTVFITTTDSERSGFHFFSYSRSLRLPHSFSLSFFLSLLSTDFSLSLFSLFACISSECAACGIGPLSGGEIRQPVRKVSPTEHLQPESKGTASAGASRNEVELFWRSVIACGGKSRQIISLEPLRTRAERGVGVSGPLNQDNVYFPNSLEYSWVTQMWRQQNYRNQLKRRACVRPQLWLPGDQPDVNVTRRGAVKLLLNLGEKSMIIGQVSLHRDNRADQWTGQVLVAH